MQRAILRGLFDLKQAFLGAVISLWQAFLGGKALLSFKSGDPTILSLKMLSFVMPVQFEQEFRRGVCRASASSLKL